MSVLHLQLVALPPSDISVPVHLETPAITGDNVITIKCVLIMQVPEFRHDACTDHWWQQTQLEQLYVRNTTEEDQLVYLFTAKPNKPWTENIHCVTLF